jgi:hypothetical protein
VAEPGLWTQEQIMKAVQFVTVILIALSLIPGGAHLMELPNKIGLDRDSYLVVQQIYRGWAYAGFILIPAIAATLILAVLSWSQRTPFLFATASFVLMAASVVSFFMWVYPVNQLTENWTVAPENWQALRAQWEYVHAINAVVTLAALISALVATLGWSSS